MCSNCKVQKYAKGYNVPIHPSPNCDRMENFLITPSSEIPQCAKYVNIPNLNTTSKPSKTQEKRIKPCG